MNLGTSRDKEPRKGFSVNRGDIPVLRNPDPGQSFYVIKRQRLPRHATQLDWSNEPTPAYPMWCRNKTARAIG